MLYLVFSQAGIAAQAMPPRTPQSSIAGTRKMLCWSKNASASPPPASAPITNWPSAPIFQTFAWKPSDNPTPISTSGVAFTSSSARPSRLDTGSTKNVTIALTGSTPSMLNITMAVSTVRMTAITGDT